MLLCIKNYCVSKGILQKQKNQLTERQGFQNVKKKKWMVVSEWQAVNPFNFQYLIDNSPL